ncbi:MAG: transcription elongation factor GreA [Nitrospira sp.]|nr:transcription elongation factor GreA [Candidatus Manganitrophaceae bacterium]HIL34630.1 transcription elongation factor GreA [Candidatus Manganitrophaceae bacterium]
MTPKGHEQMQKELDRLKKVERPSVITAIAEAAAHGDLSENAEYSAAKEKQAFVEGKILELGSKLANAEVIDTSRVSNEKVVFGVTVYLLAIETDEKKKYTLVGQDEADLSNGQISVQSPVGRALIGHRVGDYVEVKTPVKTVEYEILKIAFE